MASSFSSKLMAWYRVHRRPLPWRRTKDPYRIWLSEIILQQTRVAQGLPYYVRFVQRFPTVAVLARASQDEVLRLWQGLGYYDRAHRLHACAKHVLSEHKGVFPDSYDQLLTLPGIGSYTAAAIASLAFNRPVAVVDGNVYRVLSRIFGIYEDIATQQGKKIFSLKARRLLDVDRSADHNQAIMEFGALCCTPTNPQCDGCIFGDACMARLRKEQHLLPHKSKKQKPTRRYFTYFVLQQGDRVALLKRGEQGIWRGLYDFYWVESHRATRPDRLIDKDMFLKRINRVAMTRRESGYFKHMLSHRVIWARFVHFVLPDHVDEKDRLKEKELRFYPLLTIPSLPKSALMVRYFAEMNLPKAKKNL